MFSTELNTYETAKVPATLVHSVGRMVYGRAGLKKAETFPASAGFFADGSVTAL